MRILIDCDGILCDFVSAVLAAINVREHEADTRRGYTGAPHEDWTPDDVTAWDIFGTLSVPAEIKKSVIDEVICAPGFCYELDAYPGSVAGVQAIAKRHDVYFVTSDWRTSPTWVFDRNRWLRNVFGTELGSRVVHTAHKHVVDGDMLIDDKPSNVDGWSCSRRYGAGLVWTRPWNIGVGTACSHVSSWDDVDEVMRRLAGELRK